MRDLAKDSPGAIKAWKRRWKLVREAEVREIRRQSVADKLAELNSLLRFNIKLGIKFEDEPGDTCWDQLRRKLIAKEKKSRRTAA
ncbi:MAG: hypothetical protein IT462_07700 [Planctomycetes bacterium]|nr:hypothetical protein [Planctomycetota bacterium]